MITAITVHEEIPPGYLHSEYNLRCGNPSAAITERRLYGAET